MECNGLWSRCVDLKGTLSEVNTESICEVCLRKPLEGMETVHIVKKIHFSGKET